ncbi:Thiol-disulfide oxidoreductase ResA [Burkholderiales bacterium]|nr:Thiol-disulfide oxidoreductase ResA [Burkholderiales bacterium]
MSWTSCFRRLGLSLMLALGLVACSEEPAKPLLQVGEKATPFTLELVDGAKVKLEDYLGKGLVITFMSSWCPCSNNSMPLMQQAVEAHRKDGIEFMMIGIQDSRTKFQKFTQKWNVRFAAGYDKGDRIAKDYGVSAPPTTFFIDRQGVVRRAFYGDISVKPEQFRQWVGELAS